MGYPSIGQLNRLVRICSSDDVVVEGSMCLKRKGVRPAFAQISPLTGITQGAAWSASGRNVEDKPTHKVTLRAIPDLEITRTAWLYEERYTSANRWFKVLTSRESEDAQWWIFFVIVDSRTDTITPVEEPVCEPTASLARPVRL